MKRNSNWFYLYPLHAQGLYTCYLYVWCMFFNHHYCNGSFITLGLDFRFDNIITVVERQINYVVISLWTICRDRAIFRYTNIILTIEDMSNCNISFEKIIHEFGLADIYTHTHTSTYMYKQSLVNTIYMYIFHSAQGWPPAWYPII